MTAQSPPTVLTPGLLARLRSQEHLPDDVWYIVAATTLAMLNRPEEIPTVYRHAVARGHSGQDGGQHQGQDGTSLPDHEQLRIARRLREALLKTSAIGGLPKVRRRSEHTHTHKTPGG